MEACFQSQGLAGFANWMRVQVQEEMVHAMKRIIYQHRNGRVELRKSRTGCLNGNRPLRPSKPPTCMKLRHSPHQQARGLGYSGKRPCFKQFPAMVCRRAGRKEQSASQWLISSNCWKSADGLFQLDKELGARMFTPPAKGSAA